jgi:hypothetical protein
MKMRKLLVLTIVLGISVAAPAALQISVDGDPDPVDSEITIIPSDYLILDIHGNVPAITNMYWIMVVNQTAGTLNTDNATTVGAFSEIFGDYYIIQPMLYYAGIYPPLYPIAPAAGVLGDWDPLEGVLVDLIEFHCRRTGGCDY